MLHKKKPLDESTDEIAQMESSADRPLKIESDVLTVEVQQTVLSVPVPDEDAREALTPKAAAVTICSDRKLEQMIAAGEPKIVPAEVNVDCVNKQRLVELRTEIQRLTNVISVVNAQLCRIIAELDEEEDKNYGAPRIDDEEDTTKQVLPGDDFGLSESAGD